MTQRFICSFEIAHDNQVRLKICHHFSFTSNKCIIQKTIFFPFSSTGSLVTQNLSLEQQMLWTWDQSWNILLPKLDNICKNQVSSIFQYLVVFKGLRKTLRIHENFQSLTDLSGGNIGFYSNSRDWLFWILMMSKINPLINESELFWQHLQRAFSILIKNTRNAIPKYEHIIAPHVSSISNFIRIV